MVTTKIVVNILFILVCILPILLAKMFHNIWTKFENSGHSAPFRKKTDCSAEGETIHISLLIPKRHICYFLNLSDYHKKIR